MLVAPLIGLWAQLLNSRVSGSEEHTNLATTRLFNWQTSKKQKTVAIIGEKKWGTIDTSTQFAFR